MRQRLYQALNLIGDPGIYDPGQPPQRNPPSPLPTFFSFIGSRLRLRNPPPKAEQIAAEFRQKLEGVLAGMGDLVSSTSWFELEAGNRQWLDTGIALREGETITLMGDGRLYISRPLDVAVDARSGIWYRIGEGEINKLPEGGAVITARQAGRRICGSGWWL